MRKGGLAKAGQPPATVHRIRASRDGADAPFWSKLSDFSPDADSDRTQRKTLGKTTRNVRHTVSGLNQEGIKKGYPVVLPS